MKTTWRRIFYVVIIVNLLVGITLSIINAVQYKSFTAFLSTFMDTIFTTALGSLLMEHFRNVEKGIDTANRKAEGMPPLPDKAYSSVPNFVGNIINSQVAQQNQMPMQGQMPAQGGNDTWVCGCGAVNSVNANFCKNCGSPRK